MSTRPTTPTFARPAIMPDRTCAAARRRIGWRIFALLPICMVLAVPLQAQQEKIQTSFPVKYVTADAVYLEGGSNFGLAVGQRLTIKHKTSETDTEGGKEVADIELESVASTSAAGKILSSTSEITPGDIAYLSSEDVEKLKILRSSQEIRKYPQVVSFTEGDPLDEEVRESLPRPPLPEVNRARGRIGLDYGGLQQPGGGLGYSQVGFMLRIDATRLGGSYWNLSGYHRSRIHSQNGSSQPQTITDLVNRTYHLYLSYDNPGSRWVAGAGRLYIPWASSLSTIDGFYLGRRYGNATTGVFGGTSPDPSSWNYNPHRQMAGAFVNFEGGSFEDLRYSSTTGFAISRINWHPDRQFAFFENGIFYKRYLSIYSDLEVDLLNRSVNTASGPEPTGQSGAALSRSFLTVRLQPHKIISFDLSENYFRGLPTFDTQLLPTGLLDKYLFQGLSGGFHLDLPYRLGIYSSVGHSDRTGDSTPSWDYMVGATASNIRRTGIRADFRYSKFDSSFGQGQYTALMLSRQIGESLRFDMQAGQQNIVSTLTTQGRARFLSGTADWFLGTHYFLGLSLEAYRGHTQDYNQWFITLGYRLDNHGRKNAKKP